MAEVRDADAALDVIARRGSAVAVFFSRLGEGVPLPLAARELARLGVPVFPCVPGGKRPIPERGFHEATIDAAQVASWWRQRPAANLAIPTGAASGAVVVDVDVHKVDGYVAFGRATRSGVLPEPLAVVTTPTGGRHLYYPADAEREQRSWQVGRAGIDFRGDGGYIIVPPSLRMVDGRRMQYRVESVAAGPVARLDAQRLRDFLDPRPKYTPAPAPPGGWPLDVAWLASQVASRPEGERNLGLFKAACRMTATPISNSVTEAFVMQKYLRPDLLDAAGIGAFDAWAATFGQTVTQMEMAPTGNNTFRMKTRFAKFQNVPEMLKLWSIFADVKTAEDLQLPTPEDRRARRWQAGTGHGRCSTHGRAGAVHRDPR